MLFSLAVLHMFSKASIASSVTLSSLLSFALMAKGILRVRITALTNTPQIFPKENLVFLFACLLFFVYLYHRIAKWIRRWCFPLPIYIIRKRNEESEGII